MVLHPNPISGAAFEMIYRNADGSDAGMCGNGARCMALFASMHGFGSQFSFHVHDVVYQAEVHRENNHVAIYFPIQAELELKTFGAFPDFYQTYTGTDHVVIPLQSESDLKKDALFAQSRTMRYQQEINPRGTNVNYFVQESAQKIRVETYERGVEDFTLACGTGAIASALTFAQTSGLNDGNHDIDVQCAGGLLTVQFVKENQHYHSIILSGPAFEVFQGAIPLDF
jgi:diaminopimelate epimerase